LLAGYFLFDSEGQILPGNMEQIYSNSFAKTS